MLILKDLFLLGILNTIVMALSFVTLYAIGRTRTGSAFAVQKILGEITKADLMGIIFILLESKTVAQLLN